MAPLKTSVARFYDQKNKKVYDYLHTLRSLSSLLGDLFREFWRGILGGVRGGFGEVFGRKMKENNRGKRGKLYRKLLSSKYPTDY